MLEHGTDGYPVGSNGASQPKTKIVHGNRMGGPERVIDVVDERAPNGFADLDEVASHAELAVIVQGYVTMAGFD